MRKRVTLSGNKMLTKDAMHIYLARKLKFPSYYGKNLDALYDCLTERDTPLHITVTYTERLKEQLGDYSEAFLQTLQDATEENELISLSVYTKRRC